MPSQSIFASKNYQDLMHKNKCEDMLVTCSITGVGGSQPVPVLVSSDQQEEEAGTDTDDAGTDTDDAGTDTDDAGTDTDDAGTDTDDASTSTDSDGDHYYCFSERVHKCDVIEVVHQRVNMKSATITDMPEKLG